MCRIFCLSFFGYVCIALANSRYARNTYILRRLFIKVKTLIILYIFFVMNWLCLTIYCSFFTFLFSPFKRDCVCVWLLRTAATPEIVNTFLCDCRHFSQLREIGREHRDTRSTVSVTFWLEFWSNNTTGNQNSNSERRTNHTNKGNWKQAIYFLFHFHFICPWRHAAAFEM